MARSWDSARSVARVLACVMGVSVPDARSISVTSGGRAGALTTATPREVSAETDSIPPDQSPDTSFVTVPVGTAIRYAAPRARVCALKTIDLPSGAQVYCRTAPLKPFSKRLDGPPLAGTSQIFSSARSQTASLGARYEMVRLSGDH